MVPQTLGALTAFLTLVAPGIVFELLRERRRAGRTESTFREASRMALGSLVFSLVSSLLLLGSHELAKWTLGIELFVDLGQLVGDQAYARQHLHLVVTTVVTELALACALAVTLDLALARRRHETTSVRQQTAWQEVFRHDRPDGAKPWVHAYLEDGTSFFGYLRSHTASGNPDEREIVLEGAGLTYLGTPVEGGADIEEKIIGTRWPRVVIPSCRIRYLRVQYHDRNGQWVRPRPRPRLRVEPHPVPSAPAVPHLADAESP